MVLTVLQESRKLYIYYWNIISLKCTLINISEYSDIFGHCFTIAQRTHIGQVPQFLSLVLKAEQIRLQH